MLVSELLLCAVSERGMRSYGVVILLPGGENGAGLGERGEERLVEALVAQPPYEALDEGVLCGLPGADRALTDIAAAVEVLWRRRPDIARQPILMAGISRGGILSIGYAEMHPREVAGVINFVGGKMGEGCLNASEINGALFKLGGMFPRPTL